MTASDCRVIELRQYTLRPGRREELISLFEREFIHTQAAVGLQVLGIFRDADRPDRFVWLRGFADMASRASGLAAFYDGPVWRAHRDAANATMLDSDDVCLLRPLSGWPGRGRDSWQLLMCPLAAPADAALRAALALSPGTWLETEAAANDFPRLPVRTGEHLLVGLAPKSVLLPQALQMQLAAPPVMLNLQPTACSPLS